MKKMFDTTSGEETWITPPEIVKSLGTFDLDPCSADNMPYRTAKCMVTKSVDGLSIDWGNKRVWLNPPYGKQIAKFLDKMRCGIALLPSRTDTKWFHNLVMPRIYGILFVRKRISFLTPDGKKSKSPAFASILCAYSKKDCDILQDCGIDGTFIGIQK